MFHLRQWETGWAKTLATFFVKLLVTSVSRLDDCPRIRDIKTRCRMRNRDVILLITETTRRHVRISLLSSLSGNTRADLTLRQRYQKVCPSTFVHHRIKV